MDYEHLKQEIGEIAKISAAVPEQFQERCFELLLTNLLAPHAHSTPSTPSGFDHGGPGSDDDDGTGGNTSGGASEIPMQTQLRLLLAKTNLSADDLQRVLMMDAGQVHFVREPTGTTISKGQIEWALLLALKNAIENNKLETDPEAVRSICQDKGYYDKSNFAANFKKAKAASYFKGVLENQGAAQGLTNEGMDALGALIKSLAGAE